MNMGTRFTIRGLLTDMHEDDYKKRHKWITADCFAQNAVDACKTVNEGHTSEVAGIGQRFLFKICSVRANSNFFVSMALQQANTVQVKHKI